MSDAAAPVAQLEATYAAIARTRMAGLPFMNPALHVEAVAFGAWSHHWLGVLVTPWFMNLVLLPRDADRWPRVRDTETLSIAFPAGVFGFIGHTESPVGALLACSLFSPVFEFADQDTARVAAAAARAALFEEANRDVVLPPVPEPMTKRDFLRLGRHEP